MLDLLTDVVEPAAERGAHVDARRVTRTEEALLVRDGRVDAHVTEGIGMRVRANGAWGFAATAEVSRQGAQEALGRALALARALPRNGDASLAPLDAPARGHWASPCERDPFAVSLEDKLELLLAGEAALRGDPRIARTEASCLSTRTRTAYASTDGAACTQEIVECGGGVQAWALTDGDVQGALLFQRARRQRRAGRLGAPRIGRPGRRTLRGLPRRRSRCSPRRHAWRAGPPSAAALRP